MVTTGKDEQGRPIGKLLKPQSYFETYNEAYAALVEYNKNPYDLESDITMNDLFEKWFLAHSKTIGASRQKNIKCIWKKCSPIYEVKVQMLNTKTVRMFFDSISDLARSRQNAIKNVLSQMLDYAQEYDLVDKNCVRNMKNLVTTESTETNHISFTDEEFEIIKNNYQSMDIGDVIIINCYTGMRPNEVLSISLENINTDDWYIIGGSKTKAGKNRIIPIHEFIRPVILKCMKEAKGNKLFDMSYDTYLRHFNLIVEGYKLNPKHKPHDCRKQFVTMAKKYRVDEYAIKRIVGHSIQDLTESVYTDRDVKWLHSEIAKIP
jgi:integrase